MCAHFIFEEVYIFSLPPQLSAFSYGKTEVGLDRRIWQKDGMTTRMNQEKKSPFLRVGDPQGEKEDITRLMGVVFSVLCLTFSSLHAIIFRVWS